MKIAGAILFFVCLSFAGYSLIFVASAALLIGRAITRRGRPHRGLQKFNHGNSLITIWGRTMLFLARHWWIVLIALLISLSANHERGMVWKAADSLWPERISQRNEDCSKYIENIDWSADPMSIQLLIRAMNVSGASPTRMWYLESGPAALLVLALLVIVALLLLIRRDEVKSRRSKAMAVLIMIPALTTPIAEMIRTVITHSCSRDLDFTMAVATWFGFPSFMAVVLLHLLNAEKTSYPESVSPNRDSDFWRLARVFKAILLITTLDAVLWTSSYEVGSFQFEFFVFIPLELFFAWYLFPLPFLTARHNLELRPALKMLNRTWVTNFRKLVTLIILICIPSFVVNVFLEIQKFGHPDNAMTMGQCMEPFLTATRTDLYLAAGQMMAYLFAIVLSITAFQSGALDVEDKKPPPEENHG